MLGWGNSCHLCLEGVLVASYYKRSSKIVVITKAKPRGICTIAFGAFDWSSLWLLERAGER